jgi:hypothetical protein
MLMAFERERSRCDCWIDSEVLFSKPDPGAAAVLVDEIDHTKFNVAGHYPA